MPSIAKPPVAHPSLTRNELGLTVRDYGFFIDTN